MEDRDSLLSKTVVSETIRPWLAEQKQKAKELAKADADNSHARKRARY